MPNRDVLRHIRDLIDEERRLQDEQGQSDLSKGDRTRLNEVEAELDGYQDLMRERRAYGELEDNLDDDLD